MAAPFLAATALAVLASPAAAAPATSVHPVFVSTGGPDGEATRARFAAACQRAGLGAPEPAELAGPPAPQAAPSLARATALLDQLRVDEAIRALDVAASDAAVSGGAGLDSTQLTDIYLLRALATQRKAARAGDPRAWEDLVRAATLAPERVLDGGRFPPAVLRDWKRAVSEVERRPRGTLVVRAPLEASISIDARAPGHAPAVAPGLPFGAHHVRVEEPGRLPWGTVVTVAGSTVELEVPPRPALALDESAAAARGRRAGARHVLVAQPRVRAGEALVALSLVEVASELRRDQVLVDAAVAGALDEAVRRLVEQATGAGQPAPPRFAVAEPAPAPRPWLSRPGTWVAAGLAVVAGVTAAVLIARPGSQPRGFSSTIDPSRLGR